MLDVYKDYGFGVGIEVEDNIFDLPAGDYVFVLSAAIYGCYHELYGSYPIAASTDANKMVTQAEKLCEEAISNMTETQWELIEAFGNDGEMPCYTIVAIKLS